MSLLRPDVIKQHKPNQTINKPSSQIAAHIQVNANIHTRIHLTFALDLQIITGKTDDSEYI